MEHKEIYINDIQRKFNLSQSDIARMLYITPDAICKRRERKSPLKLKEIKLISQHLTEENIKILAYFKAILNSYKLEEKK